MYGLADKVKTYWRARGYAGIKVWVTNDRDMRDRIVYCIRSNIGADGFPPK